MTDQDVLALVDREFRDVPRPDHFTNWQHCAECAEHDELLRARDRETLTYDDVGNPGWDPICFVRPEGFAYYLPALARLALTGVGDRDSYVDQLAFHLLYDGPGNDRARHCTPGQRRAVATLLSHLIETRPEAVESSSCGDTLLAAFEAWSVDPSPN